ncbi:MAG: T9SS type A sorting domain-containing protein [Flavobacteriales bacterium]|nr:T9SS type A sorting domain-containing protein [Flavobacteriales bacterium]
MSIKYILILFLFSSLFAQGQITFEDQSSLLPNSARSFIASAVVDLNNDGMDDIVRVSEEGNLTMFFQSMNGGTFGSHPYDGVFIGDDTRTWGMAVADFNGDGMNDITIGGKYNEMKILTQATNNSGFWMNIADGEDIFVQGMNCFDVNNDGFIDIFACNDDGISKVLLNDGTGTFVQTLDILQAESDTPSDNSGNYGSCFIDVDNSGHADLYIAKCRQGVNNPNDPRRINLLYLNDGNGGWVSNGETSGADIGWQTWSADLGDVDNDGDMDLFMTNHDQLAVFMENDGTGNFEDRTSQAGLEDAYTFTTTQSSFQDMDNDGFIDIIISGGSNNSFCMNNGDGTFTILEDVIDFSTNSYSLGDLNHDGRVDMYAIQGGYGGDNMNPQDDRIYINTTSNSNNYLKVELEGTVSNPNGIGARITISGDWGEQIRDVKSGESYGIMCSLNQNFGLGAATTVENVKVQWPSGIVENFGAFDANSFITLVEGEGTPLQLEELELIEIDIFPNPSNGSFQIDIPEGLKDLHLNLINTEGKIVFRETSIQRNITIENTFSSGIYFLEIYQNSKVIARKKVIIE